MNLNRTLVSLLLLAAWSVTAQAQGAKTRAQVKAELAEAIRTGDMPAGGESGLKLNEICPSCYPAKPAVAGKSREQVRAELAEAIRTGDVSTGGESASTLNDIFPQRNARAHAPQASASASMAQRSTTGLVDKVVR